MLSRNFLRLAGLGALLTAVALFAAVVSRQPAADAAPTTDIRGFVDSPARCDDGQTAVAVGNTQRSLVVVCSATDGTFQYRAARVSDGATLKAAAKATSDGFEAETDGAVYAVSPTELVVTSGGKVIYRDTWIEYRQQPILTSTTTSTTTTTTTKAAG
jgi:hypothetical protein